MSLCIKMKLDGQEHVLDLEQMMISEARELLKFTGWDYLTWRTELGQSHPDAVAFAWWIAIRRDGQDPGPFKDLDFDMARMEAEAIVDDDVAPVTGEGDTDTESPTSSDQTTPQ